MVTKSFQVTVSPVYNLAVIIYSNRNKWNLQLPNSEGREGQYEGSYYDLVFCHMKKENTEI